MAHVNRLTDAELRDFSPILAVSAQVLGFAPNSMKTMARNPELLISFSLLSKAALGGDVRVPVLGVAGMFLKLIGKGLLNKLRGRHRKRASSNLRQLVAFAVSLSAGCRYCQAHTSGTLDRQGVSPEKIEAILSYSSSPLYTPAERAALDLAFAAGGAPNRSAPEHFTELRRHFDDDQILDIVTVIAFFGFLNRWNDTMGTDLEAPALDLAGRRLTASVDWEVGKHAGPTAGRQGT